MVEVEERVKSCLRRIEILWKVSTSGGIAGDEHFFPGPLNDRTRR